MRWKFSAVLPCPKVSAVPLAMPVRVAVVLPSSFSVTVRVSPSASVTVYAKLKGAFCFPRFVELALMAGAVFVLTVRRQRPRV